jgi:hypothetical protein
MEHSATWLDDVEDWHICRASMIVSQPLAYAFTAFTRRCMAHGMVNSRELYRFLAFGTEQIYGGMTEDGVRDKKVTLTSFALMAQDIPCVHQWTASILLCLNACSWLGGIPVCVPAGCTWVDIVNFCTKEWRARKEGHNRAEKAFR